MSQARPNYKLEKIFSQDQNPTRIERIKLLAEDIDSFFSSKSQRILPDQKFNSILFYSILYEFERNGLFESQKQYNTSEMREHSKILQVLAKPYEPLVMREIMESLQQRFLDNGNMISLFAGLNSTLTNLFIAQLMNDSIFEHSDIKAKIALAEYDWNKLKAKIGKGLMPSLQDGTEKKLYIKFVIVIEDASGTVIEYCDYGQRERQEKYGIHATGQGLAMIVGKPIMGAETFLPNDVEGVLDALGQVELSQRQDEDEQAIRSIANHNQLRKELLDYIDTPEGLGFPTVVSSLGDLSQGQIQKILSWASVLKREGRKNMKGYNGVLAGAKSNVIYPLTNIDGDTVRIEMNQPSTRTTTASQIGVELLGLKADKVNMQNSAQAKGESYISEGLTLNTHGVIAVMTRSGDFEKKAKEMEEKFKKDTNISRDSLPVRISLGGDFFHPTQTLSDMLPIMEHYNCKVYSFEELRILTQDSPPNIIVMGHTQNKRADKAFIMTVLKYFPDWNINICVPDKRYLPDMSSYGITKQERGYSETVHDDLMDQGKVQAILKDTQFLYISNPATTSGENTSGKGDYQITKKTLDMIGVKILAPLPASEELGEGVLNHKNSFINKQMENKFYVISTLLAFQVTAREMRKQKVYLGE